MAQYHIEITEDAVEDIHYYAPFERKIIVSEARTHLTYQPSVETKNRKRLRDNPLAAWEIRSGKYRIFYEVSEDSWIVSIVAVGHKEHNKLFIRGREVQI